MQNWIQQIIPQIKDQQGNLTDRMDACLPIFLEAHDCSSVRNLAGEMFRSINQYKYAKPFMASLAAHMRANLNQKVSERILALTPELEIHDLPKKSAPRM